MASDHQEPNYMLVFAALTVLTIVEIGVVFVPISKIVVGIMLILLALAKASLVALYFMHLRYEKMALGIIAFTPLILCSLLIFSLLPDLTASTKAARNKGAAKAPAVEQIIKSDQAEETGGD